MKKAVSLLMSLFLLVTSFGTVFAASNLNLTYHITSDNNYEITVPGGTIIEVAFAVENKDGQAFNLTQLQNEIYFDHDFFEFVDGSASTADSNIHCDVKVYSDDEHRVFVNTVTDTDFAATQKIASFKLKVTETTIGASSWIETRAQKASDTNGVVSDIAEENLKVIIGESNPNAKKYDISYYDDGNLLYKDEDIIEGSTTNLRMAPQKDGYKFVGWKVGDQVFAAGSEITVTGDVAATAKWEAKQTYVLSFNTNGGSFIQAVSGVAGSTIQLSQAPTRSGYTFDGWFANASLSGSPITSITLTADTTVYAKWSQNSGGSSGGGGGGGSTTEKETITFKTTDGIELESVERASGSTVDLSKYKYHKEGYTFEGWYTDKELTDKVTSIKLTEDITLYANWVAGENVGYHPEILTTEHYAYIMGRDGGLICPQDNITRAEVATIFFRLLTENVRTENLVKENAFSDVAAGEWYNTAISTLTQLEILKGRTEKAFEPDAYITRAEFTAIAARFSDGVYVGEDYFNDTDGHWAKEYINTAANLGWIVGENGKFRPDDNITRAEVMTLVNRVLNRIPESEEDLLDGMTKWADNADTSAWYYLAVQEATNSHNYEMKADGVYEKWTSLTESPDWTEFEK